MSKQELMYYSGDGWGNTRKKGKFQISHGDKEIIFDDLHEAEKYYQSINEEKCAWDITTQCAELIDAHVFGLAENYDPQDLPF